MKNIILTGGGSAGHVTGALALVDELKKNKYDIHYIGGSGIERDMASKIPGVTYHEISCEKLRRSMSLKNLAIPYKVLKGIVQTIKIIDEIHPKIIFAKGGFVSLPVCIAGRIKGIPIIGHESDITMGLANKIIYRMCTKMGFAFEVTAKKYAKRGIYCGTPIRSQIYKGEANKIHNILCPGLPNLLVFGGSLGAKAINEALISALPKLKNYNVIHITGKGNVDHSVRARNYHAVPFVDNIEDYFAAADIIVSRAGSNSIFEMLALTKPMILIPLPKDSSRGDQILNAKEFEDKGYALCLMQEDLSADTLVEKINYMNKYKQKYIQTMKGAQSLNATKVLIELIKNYSL